MVPAVACVCPTMGRPELHADLYRTFASQDYPNKQLYVLDEGPVRSAFFGALNDGRVRYVHAPAARGDVTRIGTARNKLMAMVGQTPLIAHVDDDDAYAPEYLSTMIGRLLQERGDVAKLSVFNNLHGDQVYQWDVRQMGGKHYAIKGAEPAALVDVPEPDPTFADAMRLGFGFSYVFQRSAWDRVKFPAEGTEDYPWIKQLQTLGAKIVHVHDYPEGVLHVVHAKSASMLFPQRHLGHRRALGLGAVPLGMRELPAGQDIQLQPGSRYAVVASVKRSNSIKDIAARCATWGLVIDNLQDNVSPSEYGVGAPPSDYRLIYALGTAKKPTRMPWKVPLPASWFNSSSCLRAWTSAPHLNGVVRSMAMTPQFRPMFAAKPMLGAWFSSDVDAAIDTLDPAMAALNTAITACSAMTPIDAQGWADAYTRWQAVKNDWAADKDKAIYPGPYYGSGIIARVQLSTDDAITYQAKVAIACPKTAPPPVAPIVNQSTPSAPGYRPPDWGDQIAQGAKAIGVLALVGVGAYALYEAVSIGGMALKLRKKS